MNARSLTLIDVGNEAGVSAITVSRVLNCPEKVSKAKREAVEAAIAKLGYVPNAFARSLASSRSRIIAVLVPSLSNAVFPEVLDGIYDVCGEAGYRVLVANTHYSVKEEESALQALLSQSPEGVVLTGGGQSRASLKKLKRSGVNVVQMMEMLDKPIDLNVGIHHVAAGAMVANYFLSQGAQRIGFIAARMDARVQQRLQGFTQVLEKAKRHQASLVQTTVSSSSIAVGGELFQALIRANKSLPDAVFCGNDDLALGALFEAQRMKIDIPGAMMLCGFNDIEAARYVNPSLTSVHINRYLMGRNAAALLLRRIRGETFFETSLDMGFELRIRNSTLRDGSP